MEPVSIGVTVSPDEKCHICGKPVGAEYLLIYGVPPFEGGPQLLALSHPFPCGVSLMVKQVKIMGEGVLRGLRDVT